MNLESAGFLPVCLYECMAGHMSMHGKDANWSGNGIKILQISFASAEPSKG